MSETPVWFAFEVAGETCVIQLDDPALVAHARALLAGETAEAPHIMGRLIKSEADYNIGWSFHLDPDSIEFFDMVSEVGDAAMYEIEANLDGVGGAFLPGSQWTPWTSHLFAELDRLDGGDGHDQLQGGAGADLIVGGGGGDSIAAGAGRDFVGGGLGADRLAGQAGDDKIEGGRGADLIRGGGGGDLLFGDSGKDELFGDGGDDALDGGAGGDRLDGGAGHDLLWGGGDDDLLHGAGGRDRLVGGQGADLLLGGDGRDHLVGGLGRDTLEGGGGDDLLDGGKGADLHRLTDADIGDVDTIRGFSPARGDILDLSAIDADVTRAGDQAFTAVEAFTGEAGQARRYEGILASVFEFDVDGDGAADLTIIANLELTFNEPAWVF